MKKLYHRTICWGSDFDTQSKKLLLSVTNISKHLQNNMYKVNDPRYDIKSNVLYRIIRKLSKESVKPFEVETENNKVVKAVIRTEYDKHRDISIVVRKGFIVTAWLNEKTDTHRTLDTNKYEKHLTR